MKLLENQSSVTEEELLEVKKKRVPKKSKLYEEFECTSDSSENDVPPVPPCKPLYRKFTDLEPVPLSPLPTTLSVSFPKPSGESAQTISQKSLYSLKNSGSNGEPATNMNSTSSGSLDSTTFRIDSQKCHCKNVEGKFSVIKILKYSVFSKKKM